MTLHPLKHHLSFHSTRIIASPPQLKIKLQFHPRFSHPTPEPDTTGPPPLFPNLSLLPGATFADSSSPDSICELQSDQSGRDSRRKTRRRQVFPAGANKTARPPRANIRGRPGKFSHCRNCSELVTDVGRPRAPIVLPSSGALCALYVYARGPIVKRFN